MARYKRGRQWVQDAPAAPHSPASRNGVQVSQGIPILTPVPRGRKGGKRVEREAKT